MAITDANKKVEQEMSYDAWGRRRNPNNWTYSDIPACDLINRGYTFHQHYDKLGLINMNGRVYDPIVGRFLSVDPVVGNPLSAQDYNGYSYCANNPLKYTDPSGYQKYAMPYPVIEFSLSNGFTRNGAGGGGSSLDWWGAYQENVKNGYTGGAMNFVEALDKGKTEVVWWTSSSGKTGGNTTSLDKDGNIHVDIGEVYTARTRHSYTILQEPKATGGFVDGFMNPKSQTGMLNTVLGGDGVIMAIGEGISSDQMNSSLKALQRAGASTKPIFKSVGKGIGYTAAAVDGLDWINNRTWGNATKVGIDIATVNVPFGWVYGCVDLGFALYSGTSLTDRIGSGIDSSLDRAGGIYVFVGATPYWISNKY